MTIPNDANSKDWTYIYSAILYDDISLKKTPNVTHSCTTEAYELNEVILPLLSDFVISVTTGLMKGNSLKNLKKKKQTYKFTVVDSK